ncbi:MAG: flagellar motor switch protein FliN [Oligoflexia bacterium]|nr:flagellar motor switch protein FliN [Oligoflexia bacterium]
MADKAEAEEATENNQAPEVQEVPPPQDLSSQAEQRKDAPKDRNLDLIMDIPLKVSVELGRTKMIVHDLLALGQGSVIELTKLAGEPMEVLVNDKLVARGEAVVVNEKFGVRLTDIISPTERIQQLNK